MPVLRAKTGRDLIDPALLRHPHNPKDKSMTKTLHLTAIALCWIGMAFLGYIALVLVG